MNSLGVRVERVNSDLLMYKGILSKMSAAKELMEEMMAREKKKQAERDAGKADKVAAKVRPEIRTDDTCFLQPCVLSTVGDGCLKHGLPAALEMKSILSLGWQIIVYSRCCEMLLITGLDSMFRLRSQFRQQPRLPELHQTTGDLIIGILALPRDGDWVAQHYWSAIPLFSKGVGVLAKLRIDGHLRWQLATTRWW